MTVDRLLRLMEACGIGTAVCFAPFPYQMLIITHIFSRPYLYPGDESPGYTPKTFISMV